MYVYVHFKNKKLPKFTCLVCVTSFVNAVTDLIKWYCITDENNYNRFCRTILSPIRPVPIIQNIFTIFQLI